MTRSRMLVSGVLIALALCAAVAYAADRHEVTFEAADGVQVYADLYPSAADLGDPLILLFHQAGGDARGEYEWIAERLIEQGFAVLAVDQRVGGDRFGQSNRTVEALASAEELGYCEAYPDLLATLDWVEQEGFTSPVFAWGSSFSAALVLRLAAERGGDLEGVLAFSPAPGRMGDCEVETFAPQIEIPVLVFRPETETEYPPVQQQMQQFDELGIEVFVSQGGSHGSSLLHPDRVKADHEPAWARVEAFLETAVAAESSEGPES